MKKNDFMKKRTEKIRSKRKQCGKLSDNTIDNKKFRQQKLLEKKLERRALKKAMKEEKYKSKMDERE